MNVVNDVQVFVRQRLVSPSPAQIENSWLSALKNSRVSFFSGLFDFVTHDICTRPYGSCNSSRQHVRTIALLRCMNESVVISVMHRSGACPRVCLCVCLFLLRSGRVHTSMNTTRTCRTLKMNYQLKHTTRPMYDLILLHEDRYSCVILKKWNS